MVVYFTLPSGQEEILIDYNMCFVDKISFQEFKDAHEEENAEEDLGGNNPKFGMRNNNSLDWITAKKQPQLIDPEFQLCTLIDFLKK